MKRYRSSFDQAVLLVCAAYDLERRVLLSRRRAREIAWPRQLAMWLLFKETAMSLPKIGQLFARDHTTVMHACKRVEQRMSDNLEYQATAFRLMDLMQNIHHPICCGTCANWGPRTERLGDCLACLPVAGPNGHAVWPITSHDKRCPQYEVRLKPINLPLDDQPELALAVVA